jgi:hypothetical protein
MQAYPQKLIDKAHTMAFKDYFTTKRTNREIAKKLNISYDSLIYALYKKRCSTKVAREIRKAKWLHLRKKSSDVVTKQEVEQKPSGITWKYIKLEEEEPIVKPMTITESFLAFFTLKEFR